MEAPLLTLVTDLRSVPEAEVVLRLERLRSLPSELRARVAVQVRGHELSTRQLLGLARRLRSITRELGVGLLVNDRLDVALLVGADGVHLGGRSIGVADARSFLDAGAFVSVACHSIDEVLAASAEGASACVLSPIFHSPGKGIPLGVSALCRSRSALDRGGAGALLIALGGIDAERAAAALAAGAHGVAAIRADLDLIRLDLASRG